MPASPRKEAGKIPGATVAMTLNSHAMPVPIAMRVNMFRLRVRTEAQPRTKKGHPAHSTTGVARMSWSQTEARAEIRSCRKGTKWRPISRITIGMVKAVATQKRRVMSASSGLGPVSAVTVTGSRAIPQIGHGPGPGRRISGCIGHVHSATSSYTSWLREAASSDPCGGVRKLAGSCSKRSRQRSEQKWYGVPS